MADYGPPGTFWWSASMNDLYIEIGLMFCIAVIAVIFGIFLYRRGWLGKFFYHAQDAHVAEEFNPNGSYDVYDVEPFGPALRIKNGPKKDQLVITKPETNNKTRNGPMLTLVLGKGKGMAVNPYVAEYLQRMEGNETTLWLGQRPPQNIADLKSLYLAYARMKAAKEQPDPKKKQAWIDAELSLLQMPDDLPEDKLKEWTKGVVTDLNKRYEDIGPTFKAAVHQLEDPSLPLGRRFEIYDYLNVEMRAEPPQMWSAAIAGVAVGLPKVADFVESMTGTELKSFENTLRGYLEKQNNQTMKWVLILCLGGMMLLIGAAIAISVIH